jgi:3-oxoacyl-[acyl-carrier protein] reductase
MVALIAAPSVERTWHASDGDWAAVGGYFADRDPARTFACTEVMTLG